MSTKETSPSPSSQNQTVVKAVAATAASTLLIAGILFYFFYRCVMARQRQKNKFSASFRQEEAAVTHPEFTQQGSSLKRVVVNENGSNVLYFSQSGGEQLVSCFSKVWFNPLEEEEKRFYCTGDKPETCEPIHEIPLIHRPSYAVDYATEAFPCHPQQSRVPPPDPRPASPLTPLLIPTEKNPPPPPPPPPPHVKQSPSPPPPPVYKSPPPPYHH